MSRIKILLTILGLLNGGYMLTDGVFVLLNGKYIGPNKPGPWANIFYKLNVDVFQLGPLFIVLGMLWLLFLFSLWTNRPWVRAFGITISLLTLWYLSIGTLISVAVLILLLRQKSTIKNNL